MKLLVVIDMQNDFVTDALGTKEAVAITENVLAKVKAAKEAGDRVIFTRDTHTEDYLNTQEGRILPVPHCIKGTRGWQLIDCLRPFEEDCTVIDKPSFGSVELGSLVAEMNAGGELEEITLIGLCTDIGVISNAMILKASCPEVPITVDSSCCAGVSPATHDNALEAMKVCQITVV